MSLYDRVVLSEFNFLQTPSPKRQRNRLGRLGQLRRVKNQVWFWAASQPGELPAGFVVPKTKMPSGDRKVGEQLAEKIRKEHFPKMPSRIGNHFICHSLEGFCGKGSWLGKVYKVMVTGQVVTLDSGWYSMLDLFGFMSRITDTDVERMKAYWSGERTEDWDFKPETILKGKAIILGPAEDYDFKRSPTAS